MLEFSTDFRRAQVTHSSIRGGLLCVHALYYNGWRDVSKKKIVLAASHGETGNLKLQIANCSLEKIEDKKKSMLRTQTEHHLRNEALHGIEAVRVAG